jgi:hypothetical protein
VRVFDLNQIAAFGESATVLALMFEVCAMRDGFPHGVAVADDKHQPSLLEAIDSFFFDVDWITVAMVIGLLAFLYAIFFFARR